jgi:hypothetical protein
VAVLDCGDRITVRRNPPRTKDESLIGVSGDAEKGGQVLEAGVAYAQAVAATRFPAPRVHVLPRAGTPQDRMLYCRLSPAHTDTAENILRKLKETPDATPGAHSTPVEVAANASLKTLCDALTLPDVEGIIAAAPFTDQPFFEKYLLNLAPAQASGLFGKLAPGAESAPGSAPPTSQSMDRGPISVFQPPPQSRAAAAYSTEGALPI